MSEPLGDLITEVNKTVNLIEDIKSSRPGPYVPDRRMWEQILRNQARIMSACASAVMTQGPVTP